MSNNYVRSSRDHQEQACGDDDDDDRGISNIKGGCLGGDKVKKRQKRDHTIIDDATLARELNELTVKERNKVLEDIHGVATITEETPELVQDSLEHLAVALSNTPRLKRKALDRAIFLKPSLHKDKAFNLMFLRADQYDANKAARRICKYFTNKLELFGENKLVKKITLNDLNEDDMATAHTGTMQILPVKDTAGRTVWFVSQSHFKYKHWKNQIRYCWYQVLATLEDEDAQIKGMVDVVYCVGMENTEPNFNEMMVEGGHMLNDLPFRMQGLHFCYNDARLRPAISLIQMIVGKQTRLRFRNHYGSNLEVQYALMTFGIPMRNIPIRSDGSLKTEINDRYLAERRRKEAEWKRHGDEKTEQANTNAVKATILYRHPSPNDVVLGRGRPYQGYSGNRALAGLIEAQREQYQKAADRFEKTCISMDVVKSIKCAGGRFLQRIPEEGWEEVNDHVARDKVSHSFRTKTTRQNTVAAPTEKVTTLLPAKNAMTEDC